MTDEKIKVLYVAGWGRSGSTILSNILGQVDGLFSVGELRYIWERNFIENRFCGCGVRFSECEVWSKILESYHSENSVDVQQMSRWCQDFARTRHLIGISRMAKTPEKNSDLAGYLYQLEKFYRAISTSTGSKIIVDSSKFPSYGALLDLIPSVDLYVIFLVRDARATAYSWKRRKIQPDTGNGFFMQQINPLKSSLIWDAWNVAIERLWGERSERFLFLRYEEFISQPQKSIESILNMLNVNPGALPFLQGNQINMGIHHTVSGNPVRFDKGIVELRADNEWKGRMRVVDRTLVTALTWPLLLRYGYFSN